MIDYAAWRHPRVLHFHNEPSVLTPMQRNVFWLIASGVRCSKICNDLLIVKSTLHYHRQQIALRIPGLVSFSSYGALAAEIQRLAEDVGVFSETAAANSLVDASSSAERAVSAAGSPAAMASSSAALKPLIRTMAD